MVYSPKVADSAPCPVPVTVPAHGGPPFHLDACSIYGIGLTSATVSSLSERKKSVVAQARLPVRKIREGFQLK